MDVFREKSWIFLLHHLSEKYENVSVRLLIRKSILCCQMLVLIFFFLSGIFLMIQDRDAAKIHHLCILFLYLVGRAFFKYTKI